MKYTLEDYEHFRNFGNYLTPRSIETLRIIISKLKNEIKSVDDEIDKSEIVSRHTYLWAKARINRKIEEKKSKLDGADEFCNIGGYPLLSIRVLNCLKYAKITTIDELKKRSLPKLNSPIHEPNIKIPSDHILRVKNFGRKSYNEVLHFLSKL